MKTPVLVIHGGAGVISKNKLSNEQQNAYHTTLKESLIKGYRILNNGGSCIDAVEAAIKVMEDSPLFNAGKGSVFTHEGTIEMDAAIMSGKDLQCGAVAAVRGVKNPISLAKKVMTHSNHVLLAGKGAENFAKQHQIPFEAFDYFVNEKRLAQLKSAQKKQQINLDHSDDKYGTVGAVALDTNGNLAAGTSTGGMTNKQFGRIGDSPLIGAGTYANKQCAVSCTGLGEIFIQHVVAHKVAMYQELSGLSIIKASEKVIFEELPEKSGGLIVLDNEGNFAMPYNTEGMFRGIISDKTMQTKIWE